MHSGLRFMQTFPKKVLTIYAEITKYLHAFNK